MLAMALVLVEVAALVVGLLAGSEEGRVSCAETGPAPQETQPNWLFQETASR